MRVLQDTQKLAKPNQLSIRRPPLFHSVSLAPRYITARIFCFANLEARSNIPE